MPPAPSPKPYTTQRTPHQLAVQAWNNILHRLKRPSYGHVRLRITREEFMNWAEPAYTAWFRDHPGVRPSVDRIDNYGHYELSNLQMISHSDNSAKRIDSLNLYLPPGFKLCAHCRQELPWGCFSPDPKGTFGLDARCRVCNARRKRALRKQHRLRLAATR